MSVRVDCRACKKAFMGPDHLLGKTIKCPGCAAPISIPVPVTDKSLGDLLDEMAPALPTTASPNPLATFPAARSAPLGGGSFRSTYAEPKDSPLARFFSGWEKSLPGLWPNRFFILGLTIALLPLIVLVLLNTLSPNGSRGLEVQLGCLATGVFAMITLISFRPGDKERFAAVYGIATFLLPAIILASAIGRAVFFPQNRERWGRLIEALFSGELSSQQVGYVLGTFAGMLLAILGPPAVVYFLYRQFGFGRVHTVMLSLFLIIAIPLSFQERASDHRMMAQNPGFMGRGPSGNIPGSGMPTPHTPGMPSYPQERRTQRTPPSGMRSSPHRPSGARPGVDPSDSGAQERSRFPEERRGSLGSPPAFDRPGRFGFESSGQLAQFERRLKTAAFREDAYQVRELERALTFVDDERLVTELKSCAALKRPLFQLYWAFALESVPAGGADRSTPTVKVSGIIPQEQPDQFWNKREVEKQLGEIGEALLDGLQTRVDSKAFGSWASDDRGFRGRHGHSGVTILPAGTANETLNTAAGLHADLLLAARIDVKPTGLRKATATLTLRVVDVLNGKELWKSEPVSSTAFAAKGRQDDLGGQLVNDTFNFIDNNIRLGPLPDIKPEVARKRMVKLAETRSSDVLAALIELRYYQVKKLLSVEEIQEAYGKLRNEHTAKQLAGDDVAERIAAISVLLPAD